MSYGARQTTTTMVAYIQPKAPRATKIAAPSPSVRDKPAAYVAYERGLAKTKQPMPARMKRGLHIYMRGVVATRPCRHCSQVASHHPAKHNNSRNSGARKPYFGGICVMPGKSPKEYGGCCACIAAGVPGCSAEYDASLTPPPSVASSPITFTAANHVGVVSVSALGKRQREMLSPLSASDEPMQREPKRRMTTPSTLSPMTDSASDESIAQTLLALSANASPSTRAVSRYSSGDSKVVSNQSPAGVNAGLPMYMTGAAPPEPTNLTSYSTGSGHAQLKHRAAELRQKLDRVAVELAAVGDRSAALVDEQTHATVEVGATASDTASVIAGTKQLGTDVSITILGRVHRDTTPPSPQASDVEERLDDAVTPTAATSTPSDEWSPRLAKRTPNLTHDDLLTFATTWTVTPTIVQAYLATHSAAPSSFPSAPDAADSASATPSSPPFASVYAFDPLFWPSLCRAPSDVSAWRDEIAAASRHDVVLIPAPVVLPGPRSRQLGQGLGRGARKHWLLLMVLRAERVIECYDSLCDSEFVNDDDAGDDEAAAEPSSGEDRCWRALETARTALVERELGQYWSSTAEAGSSASSPASSVAGDGDGGGAGEWELRIMKCSQQQQQQPPLTLSSSCVGVEGDSVSSSESASGSSSTSSDQSALYMLWHARCILLGAPPATLTHVPPPPGFRACMLRELGAVLT